MTFEIQAVVSWLVSECHLQLLQRFYPTEEEKRLEFPVPEIPAVSA